MDPKSLTNIEKYKNKYKNKELETHDNLNLKRKLVVEDLYSLNDIANFLPRKKFTCVGILKENLAIERKIIWFIKSSTEAFKNFILDKYTEDYYYKKLDNNWNEYKNEDIIYIDLKESCNKEIAGYLRQWLSPLTFKVKKDKETLIPVYTKVIISSKENVTKYFENYQEIIKIIQNNIKIIKLL